MTTERGRAGKEADQAKQEAADRWPKIHRLADSLRKLREENHFAEMITEAFGGKS